MNIPDEMRTEYNEYIKSYRWKQRRDAAMQRAKSRCERCGFSDQSCKLEVHHVTYANFKNEKPEDLRVLCTECHAIEDKERERKSNQRSAAALENARVDGWMRKKFGDEWQDNVSESEYEHELERFDDWLERQG
jgi:5-methylcytosine-specific restriction endonuclease McrA